MHKTHPRCSHEDVAVHVFVCERRAKVNEETDVEVEQAEDHGLS